MPKAVAKRIALRRREILENLEQRRAELMQAGVGELHLRLDADGARDAKPVGMLSEVLQQDGFPDPRLAAHNQDAAVLVACVRQQALERFALVAPAAQPDAAAALC